MVLYVMKYDIHPDKSKEYFTWAESAIPRILRVPGVIELRGYRTAAGSNQIVVTLEFLDMENFGLWFDNEEIQELVKERRNFTSNEQTEIWGPSPVVPDPIRP